MNIEDLGNEGLVKSYQLVIEEKVLQGIKTWWLYVCSFHTGKDYFAVQITLVQFKGFTNSGIVRIYRDAPGENFSRS